jgi:hypothetical protein
MARGRISLAKEDRIAQLFSQGYRLDEIARICNCSDGGVRGALKRYGRRWRYPDDPRKGRQRGFLSDAEIEAIHEMRTQGHTLMEIGRAFYGLTGGALGALFAGRTYQTPEDVHDYSDQFINRWRKR